MDRLYIPTRQTHLILIAPSALYLADVRVLDGEQRERPERERIRDPGGDRGPGLRQPLCRLSALAALLRRLLLRPLHARRHTRQPHHRRRSLPHEKGLFHI